MRETLKGAALQAPSSDTGLMKTVAMVTMLVDHVGVVFFPSVTELRVIGRIAFPLFAWCAVVGSLHTRSWRRYALRLLLWGLVSQPAYMLGLNHRWDELNVMFTLLLGTLGIAGMREKKWGSGVWAPLLCVAAGALVQMDYGWKGVLLIQLMYLSRHRRGALSALMLPFCLYWGAASRGVDSLFGLPLRFPGSASALASLNGLFTAFLKLQALALLSLPLMLRRGDSGLRVPKWLAYGWYPGHLLILYAIAQASG